MLTLLQVRAFAQTALDTLKKAGATKEGPAPAQRDVEAETENVCTTILTLLPQDLVLMSAGTPNGPHKPRHPLFASVLRFASSMVADLVHKRSFSDVEAWKRVLFLTTLFQVEGKTFNVDDDFVHIAR